MNRLRAVADISALATAYSQQGAGAGVQRAVTGICEALLGNSGLEVEFSALRGWSDEARVRAVLRRDFPQWEGRLRSSWRHPWLPPGLLEILLFGEAHLGRAGGAIRRFLWRMDRSVRRRPVAPVADIYFSLYDPLPAREGCPGRIRVLLIHDIIALTDPNEAPYAQLASDTRRMIDSLDRDRDFVICVSDYSRREFVRYTGFPETRTFSNLLGVSARFGRKASQEAVQRVADRYRLQGRKVLLTVSSGQRRKNLLGIVQAFANLLAEGPHHADARLVLVGRGLDAGDAAVEWIRGTPGLEEHVVRTGFVSEEELVALYQLAHGFVFLSLSEGFGLPVAEAMQAGCPVVCSDRASLPEVTGGAALLVDPEDPVAAGRMLEALLSDTNLREAMTEKGRERARDLSWKSHGQRLGGILKEILGGTRSS